MEKEDFAGYLSTLLKVIISLSPLWKSIAKAWERTLHFLDKSSLRILRNYAKASTIYLSLSSSIARRKCSPEQRRTC